MHVYPNAIVVVEPLQKLQKAAVAKLFYKVVIIVVLAKQTVPTTAFVFSGSYIREIALWSALRKKSRTNLQLQQLSVYQYFKL